MGAWSEVDIADEDLQSLADVRRHVAERLAQCRAAGFWIDTPSPEPTPGEVAARATLDVLTKELRVIAGKLRIEDA